jgi:hypothetical protein
MKKFVAFAAAAALAVGAAACGSTTTVHGKPVAAKSKTDNALCATGRSDFQTITKDANTVRTMGDSQAESYISGTMVPDVERAQKDLGQLRDEATSASDQRRLDQVITGMGQLHGGLMTLSEGDYSGATQVNEGIGTMTSAESHAVLAICGGGSI